MKRLGIAVVLAAALAAGCGVTEGEQTTGPVQALSLACPALRPALTPAEAAADADLILQAGSSEGYFVDGCHRAFVMDVDETLKGEAPDVVLVVVRVDPSAVVDTWEDLGFGATSLLFLEPDPDIPDAWRPVSDAGGIVPADDPVADTLEDPAGVPDAGYAAP